MRIKKLLALLLSAALALTLFAGCGSKTLLQVLLGMLQGQYQNVSVTAGPQLENVLSRAVSENDTLDQINSALEEALGLTVSFDGLRSADAGDHTFDLVYRTGTDTQAIARQTYTEWNKVLGALPAAGRYAADLAMVQADNGWYILLDVSVLGGINSGSSGEHELTEDDLGSQGSHEKVELDPTVTYVVNKQLAEVFNGTLTSKEEGKKVKVIIRISSNDSLFGTIGPMGKVEDIEFVFEQEASLMGANLGVVAEYNYGTITGCSMQHEAGITVDGVAGAGSYVGVNYGTIQNCSVSIKDGKPGKDGLVGVESTGNSGGIAGTNEAGGEILNCTVTCQQGVTIQGLYTAGGIVGHNEGKIQNCTITMNGTEIKAYKDDRTNVTSYAGGIAGLNINGGNITNCTVEGTGTIISENDSGFTPQYAHEIVGSNHSSDNVQDGTESGNTCTGNITISGK